MNKFTFGAISGMSSLVIAVPLLAQLSSAASTDTSSADTTVPSRPIPSQECLFAMAELEQAHLENFDTIMATHKEHLQARVNGLEAAAAFVDEAERGAALQQMHEDIRASREAMPALTESITTAMEAVHSVCGDSMEHPKDFKMFMGPMGMHWGMRGPKHHGMMFFEKSIDPTVESAPLN